MKAGRQRVTGRELWKEGENKREGRKKQCDSGRESSGKSKEKKENKGKEKVKEGMPEGLRVPGWEKHLKSGSCHSSHALNLFSIRI